jgi:predicted transcriptional regulator
MQCIDTSGNLTKTGSLILQELQKRPDIPEDIAERTGIPLDQVRRGLEELFRASMVTGEDTIYKLTDRGANCLKQATA